MLLFIDNFDSFTYNLVQALEMLGEEIMVVRNNARTVEECFAFRPRLLLVGPGPGDPKQAGISKALIKRFAGIIPILGVCLGHQCIAEAYGGNIVRAENGPMHGKTSEIFHQGVGVFSGLPQRFHATRYHSLVIDRNSLPAYINVTAETAEGEIMGIRHQNLPMEGVQFHPESILTEAGMQILRNFINLTM